MCFAIACLCIGTRDFPLTQALMRRDSAWLPRPDEIELAWAIWVRADIDPQVPLAKAEDGPTPTVSHLAFLFCIPHCF